MRVLSIDPCSFILPIPRIEKSKPMDSGGSTVARLKLKGIDGMTPPGVEYAA